MCFVPFASSLYTTVNVVNFQQSGSQPEKISAELMAIGAMAGEPAQVSGQEASQAKENALLKTTCKDC